MSLCLCLDLLFRGSSLCFSLALGFGSRSLLLGLFGLRSNTLLLCNARLASLDPRLGLRGSPSARGAFVDPGHFWRQPWIPESSVTVLDPGNH